MSNKKLYRILSYTWGLPMNLIGHIVAFVLLTIGYKPNKWGGCSYFIVGKRWGGLSLGNIIICSENPSKHTLNHEFGHSIQNCYLGFLFPFVVAIPSAIRYWYMTIALYTGMKSYDELPEYDSIWFEGQATKLGSESIKYWEN